MNVLEYLKTEPKFRERKNKNKGIANLIEKKYNIAIPKDKRDDIISDILSADRAWRKALEENEDLRGSDYGEKEKLEQREQIKLGYTPRHYQDIRTLKLL